MRTRSNAAPADTLISAASQIQGFDCAGVNRGLRILSPGLSPDSSDRVGIMGFSAGGALAALAVMRFDSGKPESPDPIERKSSRPDFNCMVYPGWNPMSIIIPKECPPTFLTSAGQDDSFHSKQSLEFYNAIFMAAIPAEIHIYHHGGHGGGIRPRNGIPFGSWTKRFEEWLADLGFMKKVEAGK